MIGQLKGIAKELAQSFNEGITKTRLYMNGTLCSWIHYIELRGANRHKKSIWKLPKRAMLLSKY